MTLVLSPQQEAALRATERWLSSREKPFFYLAGYAGTGKTSIANRLTEGKRVVFGAYTGKAAEVMQRRGCAGATTIHQLIYKSRGDDSDPAILELRERIAALAAAKPRDETALTAASSKLNALRAQSRGPRFELWRDNPAIVECDMIVIDEVSMVPHTMMADLMSFGKPILVLGDPMQLPPVKGEGFFAFQTPDAMLTEIHRQAAESGVLHLATRIREGSVVEPGKYGTSTVCRMSDLKAQPGTLRQADQILCGYNKTKDHFNRIMRGQGASPLPVEGDKLVCLRNNHERGFYNGSVMTAASDAFERRVKGRMVPSVLLDRPEGAELVDIDRAALAGAGAGNDFDLISLDYAWAMTCHKAQGSQWGSVLVIDESSVARENARSWLYTAVTRAEDRVVLVMA
jgi:exodeoxyribonuclease-5